MARKHGHVSTSISSATLYASSKHAGKYVSCAETDTTPQMLKIYYPDPTIPAAI
jgi:hypothetical protein